MTDFLILFRKFYAVFFDQNMLLYL